MWCFRESLVDTDVCRLTSLKDNISNIKRVAHFGIAKMMKAESRVKLACHAEAHLIFALVQN